jgi:hypothetical protein
MHTCPPIDWDGEYWKQPECQACEKWWEQQTIIHRALNLPPYFWPCLKEPAHRMARYRHANNSPAAIALYEELEAALVA